MVPLVSVHEKIVRLVTAGGELVDLEGTDAAKTATARAFETLGRPLDSGILDATTDLLRIECTRNWGLEVRTWNGLELEVGEAYETEPGSDGPLAPPVAMQTVGRATVIGRVPCAAGFPARRCVALALESRMDAEALEKAARGLLKVAGVEVPEGIADGAVLQTEVSVVTEPDRLLPHRLEIVNTFTAPARGSETRATLTVDRAEWLYDYGAPAATKGISGRSQEELEEDCERGESEACLLAGAARLERDPSRPVLAARLFERACDHGHGWGCYELAKLHAKGDGVEKDPSRAAALHERGCLGGHSVACESAGTAYDQGRGVAQDRARATEFFRKALDGYFAGCRRGGAASCMLAAFLLDGPLAATPGAGKRRAEMYGQACDHGDAFGCGRYATELWQGKHVSPDHSRAAVLAKRACENDVGAACAALGIAYHAAEGVKKDDTAGARYCELGCEKKNGRGCFCFAQDLYAGRGVPTDPGRAYAVHLRACDLEWASACTWAGKALVTGKGVSRDASHGASLIRKACDLGSARGCTLLGEYLHFGRELAKDMPRAAELFQRGCELDDPHACAWTGFVRLKGLGVERDQGRAIEAYRKACDGRDRDGCMALQSIEPDHKATPDVNAK
jgi:hypothetical protein